jgi:general secretion pathway protein H
MGSRAEVARGFTLLELIVTLAVLAVAVAVVTPAIGRSTEGLRARTEAAGFAAALRHARERAITTQRTFRVVVDPDGHTLTIVAPPEPGEEHELRETRSISTRLTIDTSKTSEVSFDPRGVASGGEFRVSAGEITFRITVDRLTGRVKSERAE